LIRDAHGDQVRGDYNGATIARLDEADVDRWINTATLFPPANRANAKEEIVKRFDRLKDDFQTLDQDTADVAKWQSLEDARRSSDSTGAHHRQLLAKVFVDLMCGLAGAPFIARNFLDSDRLSGPGDQFDGLRKRMKEGHKEPHKCSGVARFTEEDWRRLDEIKPN
jgi:hypothetical protein